jgi:hypothetical protein
MTPNSENLGHERKDVNVGALFLIALGLFVGGAIIIFAVHLLITSLMVTQPPKTAGQANIPATHGEKFPQPRLEVKPGTSLAELHAAEEADLNSYGWIDRSSGVVRIPIDRAMQLLVERGLPDVGAGQTPLSLMQARPNESATPPRLMQHP